MFQHGINAASVGRRTGLGALAVEALRGPGEVSLEVTGPIDELLDALDEGREVSSSARAMRLPSVEVAPACTALGVPVSIDGLDSSRVVLRRRP